MIYMILVPFKYVAGVVQGTQAMLNFMNTIPPEIRDTLQVLPAGVTKYPFKILEFKVKGRRGFVAVAEKGLKDLINTIEQGKGEALTVFDIKENYLGDLKNPGVDNMGMLNHDHLTED